MVCYPWHPLFREQVFVLSERIYREGRVFRVRQHDRRNSPCRELPAWMFDATYCGAMGPVTDPWVCTATLRDLQRLLQEVGGCEVLNERRPSSGDVDVSANPPSSDSATGPVRSAADNAVLEDAAGGSPPRSGRDPGVDDPRPAGCLGTEDFNFDL